MYRCTFKCFVGAAVAFVGLSYFLYIPLHDGISDQTHVRFLLLISRAMKSAGALGEMIGLDTPQNLTRRLCHAVLSDNTPPQNEALKTEDFLFDGIPVRLYRPLSAKPVSPCVIYIHGGGWTLLNVDIYDDMVADYAVKTGYVFVSIDYRLAPEHPFPIPFDDSYRASLFLLNYAGNYGIDKERIGIAGDSAGGNLAAAVALKLSQNEDLPQLRFQWLIYPALQAFTFQLPAHVTNDKAAVYFLQNADMVNYWCNYIGIKPTREVIEIILANNHTSQKHKKSAFAKYVDYRLLPPKYHGVVTNETDHDALDIEFAELIADIILNPYFAPLMESDLSNVPPAFIITAEYDVLRDDGLLYAERLKRSGVEVEVYNAPNSIHGFLFWTKRVRKYSNADPVIDMFVNYAKREM